MFRTMIVLALCTAAMPALAEDIFDHPEIGRYQGSSAIHQEAGSLAEYTVGLGPVLGGKVSDTRRISGKVMMTLYGGPEDSSAFEILSAYQSLLESRGFTVLFSCSKGECGEIFLGEFYNLAPFADDYGWNNSAPITRGNPDFSYVLVARAAAAGKETYVSLIVSQGWWKHPVYKLDVVETGGRAGEIGSITAPGGEADDRPVRASGTPRAARPGIQLSSDGYVGLLYLADRLEFCAKAQAVVYDGFPGDIKPDNDMLVAGAHAAFLLRPAPDIDLGMGLDFRYGFTLRGDIVYRQHIDAGPRINLNYRMGDRLIITGIIYPVWATVRETDVDDSYSMTVKLPAAALAITFMF